MLEVEKMDVVRAQRGRRWGVEVVGMQGSSGGTFLVVRVEGRRCSF
jgi:hypothetical protein